MNLIRRCYAINFEHPVNNFVKKSEVMMMDCLGMMLQIFPNQSQFNQHWHDIARRTLFLLAL